MKIGLMTGTLPYPPLVREKQDGQSQQNPGQNSQNSSSSKQGSDQEPTEENLDQAIAEFLKDKQTQESGISAVISNQGPGLKVILKDSQGGVVRQLSGEEFLKLRESVSKESRSSGKILDQKL